MEIDWIRPSSEYLVKRLIAQYAPDTFVGSVHHVHTIPIDYDRVMYEKARSISGGSDERLFEDYYVAQLEMLQALRPPVVGHFDLIRLKSNDPDTTSEQWPGVWKRVLRNLDFIAEYGGLLEINSAALRKGMQEPYPNGRICQVRFVSSHFTYLLILEKAFVERKGLFTLSDDSHGVDQVGFGFAKALIFAKEVGVEAITTFEVKPKVQPNDGLGTERMVIRKTVPLSELMDLLHREPTEKRP